MPRWNDGLVDAFPIPADKVLSLDRLNLGGETLLNPRDSKLHLHILRFFEFPAEIRNRIYNLVLFSKPEYRRADGTRRGSRLALLLVSKKFHREASYALYTTHKFLIFPLQQFTALPTIQELPLYYRVLVTSLEIVVGSSFTAPPKSWKVTKGLQRCLKRLKNVQSLLIFVEFDPSHPAFKLKKDVYETYIDFCANLVGDIIETMPQLKYVQLDGNPGVNVHGPLVTALREEAETQDKIVKWGREAEWAHKVNVTGGETQDDQEW